MRKIPFEKGEFYHVFNRGVDKRIIFKDKDDINRFLESMEKFNCVEPIGSILEKRISDKLGRRTPNVEKLVNIVCYCLNPNHFHFVLEQRADGGISEFLKRVCGGYAKYFNEKYKRSGSLFQGRAKSVHINSDEHLLYVSCYVNFNYIIHDIKKDQLFYSSWDEHIGERKTNICSADIILARFKNSSEYEKMAKETVVNIKRKRDRKDLTKFLIEE